MRRILRWAGWSLLVLFGLLLAGYGLVYERSEHVLHQLHSAPVVAIAVPSDAPSIEQGERLATLHGCYLACHGDKAKGDVLVDIPHVLRINAPNLSAAIAPYSDSQLASVIRYGVRPDGRGLFIMPSQTFNQLSDEDLGRIIAFLRRLPKTTGPGTETVVGPLGRVGIALGKFETAPDLIAKMVALPAPPSSAAVTGRYLAQTVCTECHGLALQGNSNPEFNSPDLHVVHGYSAAEFTRLMREGIALGDRNVGLMSAIAKLDLSHLSDAEIASLYAYLHDFGPVGR